jgi:very-short-patch-repair endonuclease
MEHSKAKELRKNSTDRAYPVETPAPSSAWGYKFRRQQPLGCYIVDFICLEKRLVIELDGGQHNTHVIYDEKRQSWIESQDFRVLRFWNTQVMRDIAVVKEVIWQALGQT